MPLQPDFADDYARLRQEIARLRYLVLTAAPADVADTYAGTESISVGQNADSGWVALSGPSVPATTRAGTLSVTLSGRISIGASNTNAVAAISYQILDADAAVVIGPDDHRGLSAEYGGAGAGAAAQAAFVFVHTGLAAGDYTVQTLYRYADGPGAVTGTFTADFTDRSIIARGY